MGPAYFIPEVSNKGESDAAIASLDLKYAFAAGYSLNTIPAGPDKKPGAILTPGVEAKGAQPGDPLYRPDHQTWTIAPTGGFWIGTSKDKPVRPIDLARGQQLAGDRVELGDGQAWVIPLARKQPGNAPAFEQRVSQTASGTWEKKPLEKYARLDVIAERLQGFETADGVELDGNEVNGMAVDILGVNYRVGPAEVDRFELLTTTNTGSLSRLFAAFLGYTSLVRMLDERDSQTDAGPGDAAKKNTGDSRLSGGGSSSG